jgi:nicotinamidase-related amidase
VKGARAIGTLAGAARGLSDYPRPYRPAESFNVVVVDDCCAAATMALHAKELEIINMIYCHVASLEEVLGFLA